MNLKYILNLLKNDITNLNTQKVQLEASIKNYERAIDDLVNLRISKRARRILRESHQLEVDKWNTNEGIEVLKTDLFVIKEQYNITSTKIDKSKEVINALKYKQTISPHLMEFIKKRLAIENINDVDIIKIMELIKIHNVHCLRQKDSSIFSQDLFLILNMLNQGYEDIPIEETQNSKNLKGIIENTISLIDNNTIRVIENVLTLDTMYNYDDLRYIFSIILKYYQDEIINLVNILKDKDFYFNIPVLQSIKEDYKELYQKYMFVRNKLDSLTKKSIDSKTEEIIPESISSQNQKNLFYSSNSEEPNKCYFIKELTDIREESLEAIEKLLDDFKAGETNKVKYLSESHGFIELKDDQIRIVLKSLGNNNYSVMGVFIKKSDNNHDMYNNMFNRPVAQINEEYSQAVETFYKEYINNNKRKSSR